MVSLVGTIGAFIVDPYRNPYGYPKSTVEARQLEHRYPHVPEVKFQSMGNPSTNHPESMFQLSGVHCTTTTTTTTTTVDPLRIQLRVREPKVPLRRRRGPGRNHGGQGVEVPRQQNRSCQK